MNATPVLFERLLDDAAVDAPSIHDRHRSSPHGGMIGSVVVPAPTLGDLAQVTSGEAVASVGVTLLVDDLAAARSALASAEAAPALWVEALDVVLPPTVEPVEVPRALEFAVERGVPTYVSMPYDDRREALLLELAGSGLAATVPVGGRTGHRTHDAAIARALVSLADAGLPFRVTGIDRALADAERRPGYERTGVLNLLVATDAARDGADADELQQILAVADDALLDAVVFLDPTVRSHLRSVGVVHAEEIVEDLVVHGLAPVDHRLAG
jgi:hypothetical protein